jgi:hypothetical protein
MRHHGVEKLVIGQLWIGKAKLRVRRAPSAQTQMPMRAISCFSNVRDGGVLRYSMTCGSRRHYGSAPACCAKRHSRDCDTR